MQPWLGHGLTRKRRQVRARRATQSTEATQGTMGTVSTSDDREIMTRKGQRVVKPVQYQDPGSFPEGSAFQQGGGCKAPDLKKRSDT